MTARSVKALFDLSGKRALITGGSRGLGLQIAHALGEAGAKVVLSSRKQSELDEAVAELKAAGIDASAIAADCGTTEGAGAGGAGDQPIGRRRYPRQQRRRHVGCTGRRSPA